MHSPDRQIPSGRAAWCRPVTALGAVLLTCLAARAQERPSAPLGVRGFGPGGLRASVADRWGAFHFTVTNHTDRDRTARVLLFHRGQPDLQYGRDVWVPARASVASWLLVGPLPPGLVPGGSEAPVEDPEHPLHLREVQLLLYDRTDGTDRLILPGGGMRVRALAVHAAKPEPYTAMLLDEDPEPAGPAFGRLPQPPTPRREAVRLARAFRRVRQLSDLAQPVQAGDLPAHPKALDGIDHVVLATARLAENPAGTRALRHWLEQGGRLWVMLDRVGPEALGPLLGDALDFRVVDRVGLTQFVIAPEQEKGLHDRPVELVRVLLPAGEQAPHTVDGWPVWFTRRVGRGKVVFSALGPRGFFKPEAPRSGRAPPPITVPPPVPNAALEALSYELEPPPEGRDPKAAKGPAGKLNLAELRLPPEERTLRPETLRPLLTAEIGYSVLTGGTVALVFGAGLLAAVALALTLRGARRREVFGWLGPTAAVGAAAAFVALGEVSRRATPPTVAAVQIVNAGPGPEAVVHGLLAVYRPDSGPAEFGTRRGGFFEADLRGSEGQTPRLILTDLDAWHWDNVALPAGVRFAPFRYTAPTGVPLSAVARLGPEGLEGKLTTGPFRDPADALLSMPAGRNLAIRLQPDGSFRAGTQDVLPPGDFLAGAVLTDLQQRRQKLYREFLKRPPSGHREGGPVLLAWASPVDTHFTLAPGGRTVGSALLVVPLRLERCPPGTRVTIPGPLVAVERIEGDLSTAQLVRWEGREARDIHLRFQIPAEALPLEVERVRLVAKVDAPGRRITITGPPQAGAPVQLTQVENPLGPIRIEIADRRLLRPDERGGLHMKLTLGESSRRSGVFDTGERWTIDYLELEVVGTTKGGR